MSFGSASPMDAAPGGHSDPFAGMPVRDTTGGDYTSSIPEVTALREWEDKHRLELEEQEKKEENLKKERRAEAAKEIKTWYDERNENIAKKRSTNRMNEEALSDTKTGPSANPWERVVELIDTNSRTADEARDVSRMRALLIQLKSSPVVTAA